MRPIEKGAWPTLRNGRRRVFNEWKRAIPHLTDRTGKYCHFCEMRVTNALSIEHIWPKEYFPWLSHTWGNFLLACNYCNSHKLATIPIAPYLISYFWPHKNNTLKAFEYSFSGKVYPNLHHLRTVSQVTRAQNLIDLYGLNKEKNAAGESDNRWLERAEAIVLATKRRVEYETNINRSINAIVDLAKTKGFFSIWLKVFDDIPPIRTALIHCPDFHLNATDCFDINLQFQNRTSTDI